MTQGWSEHPRAALLADRKRLHLQHGPIDLIIGAEGAPEQVSQAYHQATEFFASVLETLARELGLLRRRCTPDSPTLEGAIARHMHGRARELGGTKFVTPMIAVAGAVADCVLHALTQDRHLARAYVNNGGDIALSLSPGSQFDVGVCHDPESGQIGSTVRISHDDGIGGIATSGWRGRSHSLGIADAVTVLACDAASADVAATLIANAVDLPGCPLIHRQPANELAPDSDLQDRLVTVAVEPLAEIDIDQALAAGAQAARSMLAAKQIEAVYIALQGRSIALNGHERIKGAKNLIMA